ncbi:MAG: glycosyltransferase [Luteolibacter sp.]|uniref:glycosyltransferase family 4 protein n=1 Tax=Luteolibacter sp. TaxID=1962973 RepID=UPI003266A194
MTDSKENTYPRRIAFVGGFDPRRCGIATFTTDLCEAVAAAVPNSQCIAGAVNDRQEGYKYPPRVRFEMVEKDVDSYRRAADFINFNNSEVLCVQHEFGIYGGPAGRHLLALLKEVRMPVVTTLHTILREPNPTQREVMNELIRRSDRLVVMARKGREILLERYDAPDSKIDVIPHGIPDVRFASSDSFKARFGMEGRKVLLTFGLLGPGKGVEIAIAALPEIVSRHPDVMYVVLGATHPHLVAREGETYRLGLERLAEELGLKDHVIFYNRFVSPADLDEFIGATDIYLTSYLAEAQITSGTLARVFGAGKAVVSTPYWHACELLGENRGTLVPFRDPKAIAEAVCGYLGDEGLMERTRTEAYQYGRNMIWPAVARGYLESFRRARADRKAMPRGSFGGWTLGGRAYNLPPLRLDHIVRMTDGTGIFQHAVFNVPNFHEGYCTDDNARAFVLCNLLEEPSLLEHMASTYLAFLSASMNAELGRFRNFMNHRRDWLEEVGSEDSHARALWALGVGTGRSRNTGHQRLCVHLFELGLPAVNEFTSPRAWAFALLGIHEYLREYPAKDKVLAARDTLTGKLTALWRSYATDDWPWFEISATYENARLSQALILSGNSMPDAATLEIGLKSLRWLASIQKTQAGHFRPIGSNGFYVRNGARADFDQQPVEAQAMVSTCLDAYRITGDSTWNSEAKRAFEWFLGRNDLGQPLYDSTNGGCGDGLHENRVNANQGAESSLAFQISLAEMNHVAHPVSNSH